MKPGIHCESIDQVNDRIERGEFKKKIASMAPIDHPPVFLSQKKLSVWIAPYQDNAGNEHEGHTIHTAPANTGNNNTEEA
jgi:hypothetical protein